MKTRFAKAVAVIAAFVTPGMVLAAGACCAVGAACCFGGSPCC